jgi:hypothetical protein
MMYDCVALDSTMSSLRSSGDDLSMQLSAPLTHHFDQQSAFDSLDSYPSDGSFLSFKERQQGS